MLPIFLATKALISLSNVAQRAQHADEVAHKLLNIFLTFGAPAALQSDNGREFANCVINSLREMWPELHLIARARGVLSEQTKIQKICCSRGWPIIAQQNGRKGCVLCN